MKNRIKNIKRKALQTGTALSITLGSAGIAYANPFVDATSSASEGLNATVRGALPFLVTIVLIISGVIMLIGTSQMKDKMKNDMYDKIIGVAIIMFAGSIASLLIGWFS